MKEYDNSTWYVWRRGEGIQGVGGGNMRGRDHLGDLAFDGSKMDLH